MANVITTVLNLDATKLRSGLKGAQATIKETDGFVNKAKAGWSSMWSSFTSSPLAIAGAAAAVGAFTSKAISDASNLEESMNAVNVAYGNAARGVHALGESSAESFGLSQRAFNEFSVQFSAFANDIATGSGRQVVSVVDEMTQRVADFASVNNLDMAQAAQIFQSSLAGETEALRRFGGDVSAAAVEQFALENGLIKTKAELTENIKVQARYGLLMEETAKTAGDFANTQDSLANQQRILAANVEDLSASLGNKLTPIMADAAGAANNLIASFQDLQRLAPGGKSGPVGGMVSGLIEPFAALEGAMDGLNRATGALDDMLGRAPGNAGTFKLVIDELTGAVRNADGEIVSLGEDVADLGPRWAASTIPLEAASGAFAEMQSEADRLGDALEENIGDRAEDAASRFEAAIQSVLDAVDKASQDVRDRLDLEGQLDDITDQFEAIRVAGEEAAEEGEEGTRRYREEVRRLRFMLLDLLGDLDHLSARDKIRLTTEIERGSLDELFGILGELTRGVTVPVSFSSQPTPAFSGVNVTVAPNAIPSMNLLGLNPAPVDNSQTIVNNYLAGGPTSVTVDRRLYDTRNGTTPR